MSRNRLGHDLTKALDGAISYVSGAMSRIFALNDDDYPNTGVQPYSGDTHKDKHSSDW